MTAREFFEAVAEAVREHRQAELTLEFGAQSGSGGGGDGDGPVWARVASNADAREKMGRTEGIIGEGLRYIEGLRRVFSRKADVIEMRYVDLLPWDAIAGELGVTRMTANRWMHEMFDWVDSVGWAHVADGSGVAEM